MFQYKIVITVGILFTVKSYKTIYNFLSNPSINIKHIMITINKCFHEY